MHHRPFNRILGLFLVALTSVANASGGWSGNGGDLLQEQDNAWFVGDETIEYCIERDAAFPIGLSSLQRLVQEGLSDWAAFFAKYLLDKVMLGQPGTLGGRFADGKVRGLSLTFKEVERCSILRKQITFLFGTTKPEIEKFRAKKGDALSFAIRPEYDHKNYRNGGFIWIPDVQNKKHLDWAGQPLFLKHLLLHELGHVFGMRHDSVFVMSSTVSAEVLQGLDKLRAIDETIYGQIDHPTWPYRLQEGVTLNLTYDHGGAMGIPSGYRSNLAVPEELRRALGLQADGWHSLRVSYRAKPASIIVEIVDGVAGSQRFLLPATRGFSWKGYDNGPGVYTNWLSETGAPFYARLGFDLYGDVLPFEGVWKIGTKVYPITIALEPKSLLVVRQSGLALRVYLGESNSWWVVR